MGPFRRRAEAGREADGACAVAAPDGCGNGASGRMKSRKWGGVFAPQIQDRSVARLATWVRQGRIRYHEEILDGLEQAPDSIAGLYRGENSGKRLIRVLHAA